MVSQNPWRQIKKHGFDSESHVSSSHIVKQALKFLNQGGSFYFSWKILWPFQVVGLWKNFSPFFSPSLRLPVSSHFRHVLKPETMKRNK